MKTAKSKEPLTIRTDPERIKRLKELAKEEKTTVSKLVDDAIELFLIGTLLGREQIMLTKEDLDRLGHILEAIGKPVPLKLLLTINDIQKGV